MQRDLPLSPAIGLELIDEGLHLLPAAMASIEARALVLAICLQETGLRSRWQIVDLDKPWVKGPGRGLAQFERFGACEEVATHPSVRELTRALCRVRGWHHDAASIYEAVERDDVLAMALSRLVLWIHPNPLPALDDIEGAWRYYRRAWRPGRPHRERWTENHPQAVRTVLAAEA